MKTKIIPFIAVSFFLFSCEGGSDEKAAEQTEVVTHEEHHHAEEVQAIELNDGEKWKVNEEMMPPIHNIEEYVNTFVVAEQEDYKVLAENLQKEIDLLTSSCTMQGKSHDELHKWLLPFMELVNGLLEEKDEDEAEKKFAEIQASITTFNQYFQ